MLPIIIKGCLGRNLLKSLGIDAAHMKDNDELFLYQLFLPMCSVWRSGIKKDMRKYFYSEVDKWGDIYAYRLIIVGLYSKKFEKIRIYERKLEEIKSEDYEKF